MASIVNEVRYAFRQFRQSPGFAVLAIVTLALGIGANTAMFAVIESVMLRPLPYANAARMVYIGPRDKDGFSNTSWLNCRDIRDQATTLEFVGCYAVDLGVVQTDNGAISVGAPATSPNIFDMLAVKPLLGRSFTPEEGEPGGPRSVLLSETLWRASFNADPQIVGRVIRVNGEPRTVVGVMPHAFHFPESAGMGIDKNIWVPLQPAGAMATERGYNMTSIVARLKPGATRAQAQAEMNAITAHIRSADTHADTDLAFRVAGYQDTVTGPVRPAFLALASALGLVLLIACANVANLLIARCLARAHEFAVRAAIGANRSVLARQLIVEGAVLSVIGSAAGCAVSAMALFAIDKLPEDTIPRAGEIAIHWPIVFILVAIATVSTVLSAFIPAILVARSDPQQGLQSATRGAVALSIRGRLSGFLIAGEVALSVLLLVATGLMFRTLWNMEHARLGFDVTRVSTFSAMPPDAAGLIGSRPGAKAGPSAATTAYPEMLERLRNIPGVQYAALATAPPLSGMDIGSDFEIVGRAHDPAHGLQAILTAVSGDYARVLSTPMSRGRMIDDHDGPDAAFVTVINDALAQEYFPATDPLGKQIEFTGGRGMPKPYTIVGVMGNEVHTTTSEVTRPLIMLPYRQIPVSSLYYPIMVRTVMNFVVKTRSDIALATQVRAAFKEVAPAYALDDFKTMHEAVDKSSSNQRVGLYLIGAFAGIAILMVITGLYGVLSQITGYRKREFGIRLALGATPSGIGWMVLRQALLFISGGLVSGLAVSLASERLIQRFLYGVTPFDPGTIVAVSVLLLIVGCATAVMPARRSAAVDPMTTLRND